MIGPTITLVVLVPVLVLCQFVVGTFKYACVLLLYFSSAHFYMFERIVFVVVVVDYFCCIVFLFN
jgi:hypothetical protein